MPETKQAWQIEGGPTEFDRGSIYTRVEFTVRAVGSQEKLELGAFIDSAHPVGEGIWSFRGYVTIDNRTVWVAGLYNLQEQDGNFSEQEE